MDRNAGSANPNILVLIALFIAVVVIPIGLTALEGARGRSTVASTQDLNVSADSNGFTINGKKVDFFIMIDGQRQNLSDLDIATKLLVNFDTAMQTDRNNNVRYNHTFSSLQSGRISEVGYQFPGRDCKFNSVLNVLDCNSFIINFTEAKRDQGFSLIYSNITNEFSFRDPAGGDLSYIDPIIQATGAPDISTQGSAEIVVKNSSGSLFVLYSKDPDTFVAISDDAGATWRDSADTGINCDFDDTSASNRQQGILLINSTDALHLICSWDDGASSNIDYKYSVDSGDTWSSAIQVDANSARISGGTYHNDTNMFFCETVFAGTATATDIYYTTNSGASWTENTDVIAADDACDTEVDTNGRYHVVGVDTSTDDVVYANTTNLATWGSAITIKDGAQAFTAISIAVDPGNNNIYIITNKDSDETDLVLYKSDNGGGSFTEVGIAMGSASTINSGDIVVDDSGNLHVIAETSGGDLLYVNSTNAGSTWSSAITFTDTLSNAPHSRGSVFPTFNRVDGSLEYVYVNSTGNDIYFGNYSIPTFDETPPDISIVSPGNATNHTDAGISVNWTVADSITGLSACSWSNDNGSTNITLNCGENVTNQTWSEGLNTISAYVSDNSGNNNATSVTFRIDTIGPVTTIISPGESEEFNYNATIGLNFTAVDAGVGFTQACWYNIDDGANITLVNCANISINTSDGSHTLNLYSNDTLNNVGSDSNSFTVSLDAPSVSLNYPPNNTFFNTNTNLYLNYTATDANGVDTCSVYHNIGGVWHLNISNHQITSAQQNFTTVNNTEDSAVIWNVFCNDTTSSGRFANNNFTFTTDTVIPNITIDDIATSSGSQNIQFNFTARDTNRNSCFYAVYNNSGGVDNSLSNLSVNCDANNTQITVSSFDTFNLTLYVNDSANNLNSTSTQFTTTASTGGGAAGGGGGGTDPVIITIEGNLSWAMTTDVLSDKYDFVMSKGSERIKRLFFRNLEAKEVVVNLTCEDTSGSLCQYVTFARTRIELNASSQAEDFTTFTLDLPDDIIFGTFSFNMVGTDQKGGRDTVSVKSRIGGCGVLFWRCVLNKFLGSTELTLTQQSAVDDGEEIEQGEGFRIPNAVLIFAPFLLLPLLATLFTNNKFRFVISFLPPFAISLILLILVD